MEESPLIQTTDEVEALAERLRNERVLAVDTEADSFFHYFDKLCLLQIGTRSDCFLVDPLALPEGGLAPLESILADPKVRKVFHAADYDLYILQRSTGIKVRNLFDTMISAQLLGYPAVGLAALVERHFQVALSKDQQRTDWSRRPLRAAQLDYATSDVRYLIELADLLQQELRAMKRLRWAEQEFRALEERAWPERSFDREGYLRIKGAKQLSPKELAVLRELYLMRDRRAREIDRPPFKVLGNGALLDLALRPPRSRRGLLGRKGITDLVVRRFGPEMLDAVRRGLEGPEHPPIERRPQGQPRRRLDRRGEARLERLKRWRSRRAGQLELDPGVFCPNATLEEIASVAPSATVDLERLDTLKAWWVHEFGSEVVAELGQLERERGAGGARAGGRGAEGGGRGRRGRKRRGSGRQGAG